MNPEAIKAALDAAKKLAADCVQKSLANTKQALELTPALYLDFRFAAHGTTCGKLHAETGLPVELLWTYMSAEFDRIWADRITRDFAMLEYQNTGEWVTFKAALRE